MEARDPSVCGLLAVRVAFLIHNSTGGEAVIAHLFHCVISFQSAGRLRLDILWAVGQDQAVRVSNPPVQALPAAAPARNSGDHTAAHHPGVIPASPTHPQLLLSTLRRLTGLAKTIGRIL